jgi:sporulation protein YlmC with PRC-barrel domain
MSRRLAFAYRCSMRLELGTPVRCSDGVCGELSDLVIDPTRRRVTHLVVQPHLEQGMAGSRLVPVELADSTGDQSQITLQCTLREVSQLEPVEEVAYLRLGGFPVDDPDWDVGVSNVLAQPYYSAGELAGVGFPENVEMFYDRVPKGEVELDRASVVTSSDGHGVGRVEAFIVDDEDNVTHFVLERGHLWGRRDVTIPISAVEKIETDQVTLGLTKHEVGDLPAVRVHRW